MASELLTDRLLRSWLRCKRRAWLDRHGPQHRRQWSSHRALALDDQLRSFQNLLPTRVGQGEAACQEGAAGVMGLRLYGPGPGGAEIQSHPPLLLRQPGQSRWGNYLYLPVLARQGRRLTREHRLQLALWGLQLAEFQRAPVPAALVVAGGDRRLERETLLLSSSLQHQLEGSLERLAQDLARPLPPPLVNDRKKCILCSWRTLCDEEAAAEGHLSEVSGVGAKRRDLLLEIGVGSLAELAAADPQRLAEELAVHGEQHREVAAQLVAQARVQASGEPVRRGADGLPAQPGDPWCKALPELDSAPGVLLYDIESDPDARDDFLHGFLRLERDPDGLWPAAPLPQSGPGAGRFLPLLALYEHGEAKLWRRLSRLLQRYPDWPVLHYGETEAIGLLRLGERQGAAAAELASLRARLIDVHQRLKRHWLLPVNSYGLKAVAGWQGFRWSQSGVEGARCLLWWRQWRQGDRQPRRGRQQLGRIFQYNRDDCRATWTVASWLLQQQQR